MNSWCYKPNGNKECVRRRKIAYDAKNYKGKYEKIVYEAKNYTDKYITTPLEPRNYIITKKYEDARIRRIRQKNNNKPQK